MVTILEKFKMAAIIKLIIFAFYRFVTRRISID